MARIESLILVEFAALTPQGKRNRGRPKTTWRRTVLTDLEKEHLTWGEAEKKAKNRTEWRSFVAALCPLKRITKKTNNNNYKNGIDKSH